MSQNYKVQMSHLENGKPVLDAEISAKSPEIGEAYVRRSFNLYPKATLGTVTYVNGAVRDRTFKMTRSAWKAEEESF